MMVGGRIVSIRHEPDRLCLIVADKPPYPGSRHETVGVDVMRSDLAIKLGDSIWWQSDVCLWTPADRSVQDVKIPRIGYTYKVGLTDR